MKVHYIEDNLIAQKVFIKKFEEYFSLKRLKLSVISIPELDYVYTNINETTFGPTDIFIIDIYLGKKYTGIDLAKKIRFIYPKATIFFLSDDTSKGIDIINKQVFPDYYLSKIELENIFVLIEKIIEGRKENYDNSLSVVGLSGAFTDIFVTPLEINYISTINCERSSLIVYCTNEFFTVHEKMKDVKKKFDEYKFFNKLKSFSINPYNIKKIDKKNLTVIFDNDDSIKLSYHSIKKLSDYMQHIFYNK